MSAIGIYHQTFLKSADIAIGTATHHAIRTVFHTRIHNKIPTREPGIQKHAVPENHVDGRRVGPLPVVRADRLRDTAARRCRLHRRCRSLPARQRQLDARDRAGGIGDADSRYQYQ
ncbi:hypothetical protein PSP6_310072 [Paraburkholderia tropica]|nr:hypothetical protein PSP6_310072 [Paraburkholderia tropica]